MTEGGSMSASEHPHAMTEREVSSERVSEEARGKVREEILRSAKILRPEELALTVDDVLDRALRSSVKTVGVKKLEWEAIDGGNAFRAPALIFGWIRIETYTLHRWQVQWSVPGICNILLPSVFDTPDEAKAAAQADYERRILSAIEAPSEGEAVGEFTLDEEELDTILAVGRNEQSGRITNYELKELVRVYRAALEASSVIAGLKAEIDDLRDEWQAEYDARLAANTARRAAEARISAVEGVLRFEDPKAVFKSGMSVKSLITTITGGENEVVWCESCGEAEQAHSTQYAGLCSDCWHAQGQPK